MTSNGIKSYKQHTLSEDEQFDAIITGSGMSGLACAGALARDGEHQRFCQLSAW